MNAGHHGRRAAFGLLGAALAWPALAHEGHRHGAEAAPGSDARLRGALPDLRVVDAERRRRRLVSEVLAGRVVAIDFVLTGCASLCGVVSAAMAGAQDILGARLPQEAGLLSIGLDPFADTPVTAIDDLLRRLGGPQPGGDHAPMVLVLDPQRGTLRRLLGLPSPDAIAAAVIASLEARKSQA
jgi:cytochrome oxidase Cu insertion factor (SCO1/SenC/PrrC family)